MVTCEPINIFFQLVRAWEFWGILAILSLVAFSRWERHRLPITEFPEPLPNRDYTTSFRFAFAGSFYVLIILTLYCLITVLLSIDQIVEFIASLLGGFVGFEAFDLKQRGLCNGEVLYPTAAEIQQQMDQAQRELRSNVAPIGGEQNIQTLEERVRNILLVSFTGMVLLSSSPYVGPYDVRLRERFLRFAGIPNQAHRLANQIIAGIPVTEDIHSRYAFLPDGFVENRWSDPRVFDAVSETISSYLEQWGNDYPQYREYFHKNRTNIVSVEEQARLLIDNLDPTERSGRYFNRQMEKLVKRLATLLACGILRVESDEQGAALRLQELGIATAEIPKFRFSLNQVILGAAMTIALSVIAQGLMAIGFFAAGFRVTDEPGAFLDVFTAGFSVGLGWAAVSTFYFILPLVLAAGLQLFLYDRRAADRGFRRLSQTPEQVSNSVGYLAAMFVFSYIVGFVVILLFVANSPEFLTAAGNAPPLSAIAPFPLTAAVLSVVFVLVTSVRFSQVLWVNLAIDFLTVFLATGAASLYATYQVFGVHAEGVLVTAQNFEGLLSPEGMRLWTIYGLAISTALIAATLATAMSYLSRRRSVALAIAELEEEALLPEGVVYEREG